MYLSTYTRYTRICLSMYLSIYNFEFQSTTQTIIFLAVECPEGAFYNKATQTCEMCSRGKYQPSSGQSYCLSCPLGQTTRTTGTHFLSQCEG